MNNHFRISFDHGELENLEFLMQLRNITRPQQLIRQLVNETAKMEREIDRRYGAKTTNDKPARTNVYERRRALEQLDNATLFQKLQPLLDEEFRKFPDDRITIEQDAAGVRIIRIISPSTGMNDTVVLSYFLNRWQKEKRI